MSFELQSEFCFVFAPQQTLQASSALIRCTTEEMWGRVAGRWIPLASRQSYQEISPAGVVIHFGACVDFHLTVSYVTAGWELTPSAQYFDCQMKSKHVPYTVPKNQLYSRPGRSQQYRGLFAYNVQRVCERLMFQPHVRAEWRSWRET